MFEDGLAEFLHGRKMCTIVDVNMPNFWHSLSIVVKLFYLILVVSIDLIGVDFFVSPVGVIDGYVLTPVVLLLMLSVIAKIYEAIKADKTVNTSKGDFTAEVSAKPNELN